MRGGGERRAVQGLLGVAVVTVMMLLRVDR
jgi:hypothetical protein